MDLTKDPEFSELISYILGSNKENIKIIIPKFQRMKPSKWDNEMKSKLIDSIKRGWSISSITLWKSSDTIKNEFILLNGLQRLNTLLEYYINPFSFSIITNKITDLLKKYELGKFNWFDEWFNNDIFGNYMEILENKYIDEESNIIMKHLINKWFPKEERNEIKKKIKLVCKEVTEYIKFPTGYKFSLITCKCKENELCELFSRMNTSSVNLEEHEIFAATWDSKPKILLTEDLKESLENYYKSFNDDKNYLLELKHETKHEYNSYEFIISLFYKLKDKYPYLLYKDKKDTKNPETMFKIVSICLLGKIDYNGIPDRIYELFINENLDKFIEILIKSIDFLKNLHGNSMTNKKIDNRYLIILGTYFFNYNTINNNKSVSEDYIRLNYIYSIAEGRGITNEMIKNQIYEKRFLKKIDKKILKDSIIKYSSGNKGLMTTSCVKGILYMIFLKDSRLRDFMIHTLIEANVCKKHNIGSYKLGNLSIYNSEINKRTFKTREEIMNAMLKQELKTINQLLKLYSQYLI